MFSQKFSNPFDAIDSRLDAMHELQIEIRHKPIPPPPTSKTETYLTKKQVMELMQVTSTAIWNYENRGLLKRCEFGGAVRYRLSDIEASLEFIKNPKK
jgi:predicted DNA-binding transcriptional regulator AlpA